MRIALLGDMKHDLLRNIQVVPRKIHKGLLGNDHDVLPVSFRNLLLQFSPLGSKRWALKLAKGKADRFCAELLGDYQPDLVLFLTFRNQDGATLRLLRDTLPDTRFWGFYPDPLDGIGAYQQEMIACLDGLFATGAGDRLKAIGQRHRIPVAFMPNPCDPDVEHRYDVDESDRSDVFFSGKLGHASSGTDASRRALIDTLAKSCRLTWIGGGASAPVYGCAYYKRICGTKIAISINASNDIPLYHSDRLTHYAGCGAFVLAKRIPEADRLFRDGEQMIYFDDEQECLQKIAHYLEAAGQREAIAAAAMTRAHKEFHCERIARDMIDFIQNGTYDAPWSETYPEPAT